MKKITQEDVLKISMLARLNPTPEEAERAAKDLQQVLDYVELLNEVDTRNVEPMTRVIDEVNRLREDENLPGLERLKVMNVAPQSDGECFLVPPVLD
ncbi:MAG: Asp-tRNA(Asn)/Glu-tRNA(Gln) amidotransferase subunit GatC [Planctomycetaceae bacterium]|jgi:aspartyl-tRNA(Asn)/glutamyl-tRNA(Gln) amidotransferase subunit C|nr:Asp-tRNA(Asn)/Glu-tRNA(Gln) amidotransferase subunit GatC [Planctomycetaceae bacterium]